jgi:hypothetical protein
MLQMRRHATFGLASLFGVCWHSPSCCCCCCCCCRDMSVDDAIELGRRSIYHATFRDCASGGTVSGEWVEAALRACPALHAGVG